MTLSATETADRLRGIRLLCLDVDGVLTDGHLYWSPDANGTGVWWQRFYVADGYGLKLLQDAGIELCILSGGDVRSARDRAAHLGIKHAYFGLSDKLAVYRDVAGTLGIEPAATAFVGDELIDIPLLQIAGFAATVPAAPAEVKAVAHYVTEHAGGVGAVREIADLIRRHRG